jgi:Sigma-70, region 4
LATSLGQAGVAGEEIYQAITRLPARQRQALELLELERFSYEEIAAELGTSQGSVAQLVARARVNLYDELRGTPLASVAAPSAECERSLPLIAAREDGQLGHASDGDEAWLDAHLAGCDRCRPAIDQMAEAAAFYRAWAAPSPPADAPTARLPAQEAARRRRRTVALVGASLALVLLAGLAAALIGDEGRQAPADTAAEVVAPATSGGEGSSRAKVAGAGREKSDAGGERSNPDRRKASAAAGKGTDAEATAEEAAPTSVSEPPPASAGGGFQSEQTSDPNRSAGNVGVSPPKQASAQKPSSKPKPGPTSAQPSQPSPAPSPEAPSSAPPPPTEEGADAPGRSGEAPGKPADRPPR